VPRAYLSVGSETALRSPPIGWTARSPVRPPRAGYRAPVGSRTGEGELRNRCPALLIETLQRHSYGLFGHGPIRAFDRDQRRNKSRGKQLTVIEADNRQVGWNGEPKIGGREPGTDC
jgi:hypothetical protein